MSRCLALFLAVNIFALVASPSSSTEPIGWRTNGTGSYPKAQPPLTWSKDKNVLWKTPMPGMSNSIPVLLDHRVLICSEPCQLICLHRDDGKILWQKNSSYAELDINAKLQEKIKIEQVEVEKLNKQISGLNREADLLRRKLKDDATAKPDIDKKLADLKVRTEELKTEKLKFAAALRYTYPGTHGTAGYSSPTPVTNGKEIFVAFGNGLVACFDLDGNRQWLKLIEHSTAAFAHSNSPVLIGDKVLIHFADLVALSAKDGSELWRVKMPPKHGTSVTTRIGDVDVAITPNGKIIRMEDGVMLADNLGSCGANSPLLHDGKVYFIQGNATATQLPETLTRPTKIAPLWRSRVKGGGYWFPSPVLHEGLLYAVDDRGIFSVVDAKDGKLVYEERVELGGTVYPSISLAGDRVYVSSDNGNTVVIQAGREFKELARNSLETFRSSLVFEGKRMYVRTYKNLYCIGE